jgi:hypothetical protein
VDVEEAQQLLGVHSSHSYADIRSTFRRRLSEAHPDRNPSPSAVDETKRLIAAFQCLRARFGEGELDQTPINGVNGVNDVNDVNDVAMHVAPREPYAVLVDDDTIAIASPDEEAFADLIGVGHAIGDVTYLDRQNALLEVLLRTVANDTLSLVVTLQGRANGTTEAFLSMEPLDVGVTELPTIHGVALLVAHHLNYRHAFAAG